MITGPHYQVNICGGDFRHVCECFRKWRQEPHIHRPGQTMFEGRNEVRMLPKQHYDDVEQARKALQTACSPHDQYALAAEVSDGEREIWIVMAAYDE